MTSSSGSSRAKSPANPPVSHEGHLHPDLWGEGALHGLVVRGMIPLTQAASGLHAVAFVHRGQKWTRFSTVERKRPPGMTRPGQAPLMPVKTFASHEALDALARAQDGVVTYRQLIEIGLPSSTLAHRVRTDGPCGSAFFPGPTWSSAERRLGVSVSGRPFCTPETPPWSRARAHYGCTGSRALRIYHVCTF